jgi:hypothetical protein
MLRRPLIAPQGFVRLAVRLGTSFCVAAVVLSMVGYGQGAIVPASLVACEGNPCGPPGNWTFEGSRGHANWPKLGIDADLDVRQFDEDGVVIYRKDVAGPTKGLVAIYRGKLNGPRADGTVEYTWPGHFDKARTAHFTAIIDAKIARAFLAGLKPAVINSGSNQAIAAQILSGEYFATTPGRNYGDKIIHPIRITHSGREFSIVKLVAGSAKTAQEARVDGEPIVRGTFDEKGTTARLRGDDGIWTPTAVLLVNPDHVKIGEFDFLRFDDTPLPEIPCDPANPLHVQNDYSWRRSRVALKANNQSLSLCWVRISALGGLRDGQSAWGYALLTGKGVARDERLGFQFTEKAAHQGDFRGQFNLSRLFAAGVGTPRNREAAEYWYHVASRNPGAPASMQNAEGLRILGNVIGGLLRDSFVRDPICDAPDSPRNLNEQHQLEERNRRINQEGLDCSSHALNYLMRPD